MRKACSRLWTARTIENVLHGIAIGQAPGIRELRLKNAVDLVFRRGGERLGIEHGVEKPAAFESSGQARRRTHDVSDEPYQGGTSPSGAKRAAHRRKLGQKAVRSSRSPRPVPRVGKAAMSEAGPPTSAREAGRSHRRRPAVVPAPPDRRHPLGREYRASSTPRWSWVVGSPCKHHVGACAGQFPAAILRNRRHNVRSTPFPERLQLRAERGKRRRDRRSARSAQTLLGEGMSLRLLVSHPLEAMLKPPRTDSLLHVVATSSRTQPRAAELAMRPACAHPQSAGAAGVELLGRNEDSISRFPHGQFDVMTENGRIADPLWRGSALHGVHHRH